MIGRKMLAPTEPLESCIARIETVDHAVNAMVARDFDRARGAAKLADAEPCIRARRGRPVPDLARLKAASPISAIPGFLGFG